MRRAGARLERLTRLAAARERAHAAALRQARGWEDDARRDAERAADATAQRLERSRSEDVSRDLAGWEAERRGLLRDREGARRSAAALADAARNTEEAQTRYLQARGEAESMRRLTLRRAAQWLRDRAALEHRALDEAAAVRAARAARGEGGGPA